MRSEALAEKIMTIVDELMEARVFGIAQSRTEFRDKLVKMINQFENDAKDHWRDLERDER